MIHINGCQFNQDTNWMTVSVGCNWKYYLFFNGPLKFGSYCLGLPVTKQNVLMKYWHCYCNSPLAVYKLYCRMCLFSVPVWNQLYQRHFMVTHIPFRKCREIFWYQQQFFISWSYPSVHWPTHQPFYPRTLLPTLQSIHPPTYPLIEDQSINQLIHPYINTSTYPPTLYSINWSIHTSMGARCSSVARAFTHSAMGCRIDSSWGGPIDLFLVPASATRLG